MTLNFHTLSDHIESAFTPLLQGAPKEKLGTPYILGLEDDGRAVGVLVAGLFDEVAIIRHLAVSESLEGLGYDSCMVDYFLSMLMSNNIPSVVTTVASGDTKAMDFYTRRGFMVQNVTNTYAFSLKALEGSSIVNTAHTKQFLPLNVIPQVVLRAYSQKLERMTGLSLDTAVIDKDISFAWVENQQVQGCLLFHFESNQLTLTFMHGLKQLNWKVGFAICYQALTARFGSDIQVHLAPELPSVERLVHKMAGDYLTKTGEILTICRFLS